MCENISNGLIPKDMPGCDVRIGFMTEFRQKMISLKK
jgi:hypothetical protein